MLRTRTHTEAATATTTAAAALDISPEHLTRVTGGEMGIQRERERETSSEAGLYSIPLNISIFGTDWKCRIRCGILHVEWNMLQVLRNGTFTSRRDSWNCRLISLHPVCVFYLSLFLSFFLFIPREDACPSPYLALISFCQLDRTVVFIYLFFSFLNFFCFVFIFKFLRFWRWTMKRGSTFFSLYFFYLVGPTECRHVCSNPRISRGSRLNPSSPDAPLFFSSLLFPSLLFSIL